jgi:hypothetical protein
MKQDQAGDFANTQPEAPAAPAVAPFHASWLTRLVYCVALLALVLSSLSQAASWVGLALGGGLIAWAGSSVFLLVTAALLYRVYRVLRDRQALDARPPNAFGYLLRGLGWLLMLAGAIGAVSLLLIRPLTLMIFKTGGEAGVAFFVVGLYATVLAGIGWLGCLLFEISRPLGKRVTPPSPPRPRRQRLQDGGVLVALVVLALSLPWINQLVGGDGCMGKTLGACAATVSGGVNRMAMAPVGVPVVLQSNLEAIDYRHTGGRDWTVSEKPAASLLKSGHPAAAQGEQADVRVSINAVESDGGVLVTLLVIEKGQETASFATRFQSRAKLEPGTDGKRKLVVDLQRNVQPPFGGSTNELLDEMYGQMRAAIGSEREVAEAQVQVKRPSRMMTSTALAQRPPMGDARPAASCKGILKFEAGKAETDTGPFPSGFLPEAVFVQQPAPAASVLLRRNDRVSCHGDAVWFAADMQFQRRLLIRRYDMAAALQRSVLVADMPERKTGEYQTIDEASLVERDGQIEFDLIVQDGSQKSRRERYSVKL